MHRGLHQLLVLFLFLPLLAQAETRVFTEFVYDASGNVIGIQRNVTEDPPVINSLSPSLVRIGRSFSLVASGENLFGVDVIPQDANVSVSNINASNNTVRFSVLAGENTPVGEYTFTFSTVLGSTTGSVTIRVSGPDLVLEPPVFALQPGESRLLDIHLTSPDVFENILSLSVADDAILAVSPETVTIPLGSTIPDVTVTVTAIAEGNSSLSVNASALGNFGIPVFVNEGFVPSPDGNQFYAAGVSVFKDSNNTTGPFTADSVSIFRDTVSAAGPFTTNPVSVFRDEISANGPFVSGSVSVFRDRITLDGPFVANPVTAFRDESLLMAFSARLDLLKDNVATSIAPAEVTAGGDPTELLVRGVGLESVTAASVVPPDDITVGAVSVAADGTELTVPVTVATDAVSGDRQLVLTAAEGPLVFVTSGLVSGEITEADHAVLTIIAN